MIRISGAFMNADVGAKERLIKFLTKDKIGVRRQVLRLFLQAKSYTTCELYYCLKKQGFNVNRKGVSAMVGQMHSRLGILRISLTSEHNAYSLKENYWDVVKMVLISFQSGQEKPVYQSHGGNTVRFQ